MGAPDVEQAVKSHAKVNLAPSLLAGRVFFSMPEGAPVMPLVTVEQVGGFYNGDVQLDNPRLSFSCWANTKEKASEVKRELLDYLTELAGVALDGTTRCGGVTDISVLFFREPKVGTAAPLCRYVIDATVSAASA